MTALPQVARLHESTVINAESTQARFLKGMGRAMAKVAAPQTTVIKVHPAVWAKALELADGTPSRIKVISANEVLVTNG